MRNRIAVVGVLALWGCQSTPSDSSETDRVVSVRVTEAPTVDGSGDDAVWRNAAPLSLNLAQVYPPDAGRTVGLEIRSIHTDTHVYFLVSWEDGTESVSHKTWIWNGGKYEQGKDREDMFSIAFEHTGPFRADMLAPDESVWDVWHWKAFRTNRQGYATDKTHRYTKNKPEGKARKYEATGGGDIWIARPEDAGEGVERKRAAPASHQGDRVDQYLPGTPSGSAADVRARGVWSDGRWTLELSRRLDTGHPDDTAFVTRRSYGMVVASFDRTGNMDKASGVIRLEFADGR